MRYKDWSSMVARGGDFEWGEDAIRVLRSILWLSRNNGSFPTLDHLFEFMPDLIPEHIWSIADWLDRQGLVIEDTSAASVTYHATGDGVRLVMWSFEIEEGDTHKLHSEALFNARAERYFSRHTPDAEMPELLRAPCQILLQRLDTNGPLVTPSPIADAVVDLVEDELLLSMPDDRDGVRSLSHAAHDLCFYERWTKTSYLAPESIQLDITASGRDRLNLWRQD